VIARSVSIFANVFGWMSMWTALYRSYPAAFGVAFVGSVALWDSFFTRMVGSGGVGSCCVVSGNPLCMVHSWMGGSALVSDMMSHC